MEVQSRTLAFPLVRLIIGALVLLALKEIAVQIPLLRQVATPWLLFTPAEWVDILTKTGVLALLVLTMQDVTSRLHRDLPGLAMVPRMVQLLALFVILGWAYAVYLPLATVLLQGAVYLYQLVMMVAVVATGIGFVVAFLRGLNPLSAALLAWIRGALAVDRQGDAESS